MGQESRRKLMRCPHDCVDCGYRRLRYTLQDVPQLLLLHRPVACISCGAKFYRNIRQWRPLSMVALYTAGMLLIAVACIAVITWKADDASSLGQLRDEILLEIGYQH